jgi:hypothetical protein
MPDWRTYDPRDLHYVSAKAKQIRDTAALLGVPAPGLAGGVMREMTRARNVDPYDKWAVASAPIKELMTSNEYDWSIPDRPAWKPITHQTLANGFARSNMPGGSIDPGAGKPRQAILKLENPVLWDVGPGKINIRTAISMLQNYNQMYPDSDPMDLKQYNQRYDLLVRDLKNPDNDATVKIAGLVAREGQNFFLNAMTPERWAALSDDERAAALTKYYAAGKERMQDDFLKHGGNPATYTPDFNGDGSDTYLYDPGNGSWSNPARLKNALSPDLRTQNEPDTQLSRMADFGPGVNNAAVGQVAAAQPTERPAEGSQPWSPALPPKVVANGNYLSANGIAITPRTVYMTHVLGPQRAVDLIRRTGSTSSPDIPSPDAATGRQMLAWAQALRGVAAVPQSIGVGGAAPAYSGGATEGPPSGDTSFQTDTPTGAYAPPPAPGAAGLTGNASDDATDLATG